MAEQGGEEGDHGAGHAGHFNQQTEEDKQRHGEQHEAAHALIHAGDDDGERGAGDGGEEGEGGGAEGEADGDAHQHEAGQQQHEEHQQVPVADAFEPGGAEPGGGDQDGEQHEAEQHVAHRQAAEADSGHRQHQRPANRQGGGADDVGEAEGGGFDKCLVLRVVPGIGHQHQQEGGRHGFGQHGGEALAGGGEHGDDRGQPHVMAAQHGDGGAEHGQPEEQDGGEFVGPHQRAVQSEAGDDAGQQHQDFHQNQQRGRQFDQHTQRGLDAGQTSDTGGMAL